MNKICEKYLKRSEKKISLTKNAFSHLLLLHVVPGLLGNLNRERENALMLFILEIKRYSIKIFDLFYIISRHLVVPQHLRLDFLVERIYDHPKVQFKGWKKETQS